MTLRRIALIPILALFGCGPSADAVNSAPTIPGHEATPAHSPGWDEGDPGALEQPTPYYRLELERAVSGEVTLTDVERVVLELRPVANLSGDLLLLAKSGGVVTDVLTVRFPKDVSFTTEDENGNLLHEVFPVSGGWTTVFVRAEEVDSLSLVNADGTVLLNVDRAQLSQADTPAPRFQGLELGERSDGLSVKSLAQKYPNIRFNPKLPEHERSKIGEPVEPSAAVLDELDRVLARLPSPLLTCFSAIYFGRHLNCPSDAELKVNRTKDKDLFCIPKDPTQRYPKGSFSRDSGYMALNADYIESPSSPTLAQLLPHEAAHCLDRRSEPGAALELISGGDQNNVTFGPQVEFPRSVLERFTEENTNRLSLGDAFEAMNDSGVALGLAQAYLGQGWFDVPQSPVPVGYSSVYAMNKHSEDLAELVATTFAQEDSNEIKPGVCPSFAAQAGQPLKRELAIAYGKLALLRGVGAVTQTQFRDCVAGVTLDGVTGVNLDGQLVLSNNMNAFESTVNGHSLLSVYAEGPNTYKIRIDADTTGRKLLLGAYRLDGNALGFGTDEVYLSPDNVLKARQSWSGLLVITEHGSQATQGALFGLRLANSGGIVTDNIAYATINVPKR